MQHVLVATEEMGFMVMQEPEVKEEMQILRTVEEVVLEVEEVQEIHLEHKLNQASL